MFLPVCDCPCTDDIYAGMDRGELIIETASIGGNNGKSIAYSGADERFIISLTANGMKIHDISCRFMHLLISQLSDHRNGVLPHIG